MGDKLGHKKLAKPLYVEIRIRADMEWVWELSQNPEAHPRWDLRFSRIIPVDRDEQGQVRFRYEFLLPLHTIKGTGTSLGHRHREDGQATSVLKFDTADWLSPIGPGSGYWRYIPTDDGLRFITGYNYQPGMGIIGKALDSTVIRPALGWATAISFDRLRLWAESDLDPKAARNRWFLDAGARAGGVLVAAGLFRRAVTKHSVGSAALGMVAALASTAVPSHWSVPRAGRCLRSAPDERAARALSALAGLREPDQPGNIRQSAEKE
ncbi:hypothetical protein ART_1847 [Arthrobacter sp. PAMC 25486]|uniref:hypothetical protein n=1 Tax=Arthrobacter sp. PAMC 25486 TaxID=1494608 RepID=UPI000535B6D7|nr:hypothetical protein [Arthrobacter sp. PAMC 25486]AIY01446.1 hypothetical protein ART_1847 [Arthrobacter sp. PAMC 25486]